MCFTKLLNFYKYFGNWGVAIIVFTTIIKILLYPLARSSAVSMHRMKKVQPMLNDIKQRYKDNPENNSKKQWLCVSTRSTLLKVVSLCSLPFQFLLLAENSAIISRAKTSTIFSWITDLSAADPYFVTPILGGILMLVQQKMTPTTGMDKIKKHDAHDAYYVYFCYVNYASWSCSLLVNQHHYYFPSTTMAQQN